MIGRATCTPYSSGLKNVRKREPRPKTSKQIEARKRGSEKSLQLAAAAAAAPWVPASVEIASAEWVALRRGLEWLRDDGGGRTGSEGREGAAVGCAGDSGAHRGARGDGAGGLRRAPQRQDDVGGGGRAAPGARVPPHRRPMQVQMEEPRQPLQERARNMQRQLLESESGAIVKKKLKRPSGNRSSEESDEDCSEESEDDKPMHSEKRRADDKKQQPRQMSEKSRTGTSSIHELLQHFLVHQQYIDMQWQEMAERRVQERLVFEQECRRSMQKLEQERLMLKHSWIKREDQRRMREEAREEKRDALLTTLLNKLLREDL